ncbi:thioester-containing protein 1 allele R1-like [Musca autumnalis]|uniref:thioester-containing protein 1 allele R1-like n=1 Tax=Musca autumnalis TaxID=221902 RepID=UPI003CF54B50
MHQSVRCRLFVVFILQICIASIKAERHYTILAPGTIRSNRNYTVCVSIHNVTSEEQTTPTTIKLNIVSLDSSLHLSQDITVGPNESKLVHFDIPQLFKKFKYRLKAEGIKGMIFSQTKALLVKDSGGPRIYFESDKGTYKPEDVVQFRVIILNEHMKIMKFVEPIRVQILDPLGNRVKQYKDIQLDRGIFAGKFQLSQQPISGKWTISVHISGKYNKDKEYPFQVERYVLPKFSVHLETPIDFVEAERFLPITVYGKYTYGRYVRGTVRIVGTTRSITIAEGIVIDENSKVDVKIDLEKLNLTRYDRKLELNAYLEEKFTNVTAEVKRVVNIRLSHYRLQLPDWEIEFRNRKPHRLGVHAVYWNNSIVRDTITPVVMQFKGVNYTALLNDNGVARFTLANEVVEDDDFLFFYKDTELSYPSVEMEPPTTTNCSLQTDIDDFKDFNKPVEILITSDKEIPYLMYTLMGHGNIIRQEHLQLPGNVNSHTIQIKPSIEMIPNSQLFVYYIVEGLFNYCEMTIRLPKTFENKISIAAPTRVKPGQNITLNLKAQPQSRVSIVAVDKSVILLNSKNILRKDQIMNDLLDDKSYTRPTMVGMNFMLSPDFQSGLVILTNAKYIKYNFFEIEKSSLDFDYYRVDFPETWLYRDLEITQQNTPLSVKLPDTVTTWELRAFSVNDDTGFGMLEENLEIEAFQPFFISVNLPYAVKRGETVKIPVTIFNYLREQLVSNVTMIRKSNDFEFLNDENQLILGQKEISRSLDVPANNARSVTFNIRPLRVGKIAIEIIAANGVIADRVIHKLKVEPEGVAHNRNQDTLMMLEKSKVNKTTFEANIPTDIVPGSEYLVLTVSGDVMGSTLDNLDNLVQKPKGCGEQNMIYIAPNILIMDYLSSLSSIKTNASSSLMEKAKKFVDIGYQQQLSYRHSSGGFSVFGPDSSTESNWLTAYTTRFFIKGQQYSAIESVFIENALKYLSQQQMDDGSFPQRGFLFDPAHQNEYGFTAFVLLTFLESPKYARKYRNTIEKGLEFLNKNHKDVKDIYSLAIMANTFQKAGNNNANDILLKLKSMSQERNGLKWWTNNIKSQESANDVEITAYILMALLESSSPRDCLPIFNWLIKQRNSSGGFASTHDTVVGLQALIKYNTVSQNSGGHLETQLKVHFVGKNAKGSVVKEGIFGVDAGNEIILQKQELPGNVRSLEVEVMGQGRAYLQFTYQYYTSNLTLQTDNRVEKQTVVSNVTESTPNAVVSNVTESVPIPQVLAKVIPEYFNITAIGKMSSTVTMSLEVCFSYQPQSEEEKATNMVILQIDFPSGFIANNALTMKLKDLEEIISRIDIQRAGTQLAIYFETLTDSEEHCLTFTADKSQDVGALKPSLIEIYDYYNDRRRAKIFYELKK